MDLIYATPNLEWLLLTKRIDEVWGLGVDNIRLGITVCNQEEADRDISKLLKLGVPNFLSIEPMLEPIDIGKWMGHFQPDTWDGSGDYSWTVDWVIVGGESGQNARSIHPDWARSIRDQCKAAGVPFFFKQMSGRELIPEDLMVQEFPEC